MKFPGNSQKQTSCLVHSSARRTRKKNKKQGKKKTANKYCTITKEGNKFVGKNIYIYSSAEIRASLSLLRFYIRKRFLRFPLLGSLGPSPTAFDPPCELFKVTGNSSASTARQPAIFIRPDLSSPVFESAALQPLTGSATDPAQTQSIYDWMSQENLILALFPPARPFK